MSARARPALPRGLRAPRPRRRHLSCGARRRRRPLPAPWARRASLRAGPQPPACSASSSRSSSAAAPLGSAPRRARRCRCRCLCRRRRRLRLLARPLSASMCRIAGAPRTLLPLLAALLQVSGGPGWVGLRAGWGVRRRVPLFPAPLRGRAEHPGREVPHRAAEKQHGHEARAGLPGQAPWPTALPRLLRRTSVTGSPWLRLWVKASSRDVPKQQKDEARELLGFVVFCAFRSLIVYFDRIFLFVCFLFFLSFLSGRGREFVLGILTLVS